jgi:DNA-directed RNA polymerase subunit RPC12/RpoP
MAKTCSQCGKALTFWQGLGASLCPECQVEVPYKQAADALRKAEAAEEAAQRAREAALRRYEAAVRGEASTDDLKQLEAEGYLIADGRLIRCPICNHDGFHQQRTLMNTRAATFFNLNWANSDADTRICKRCGHVLWFAR